jgi:nucleotide-binding universal stress UspA family protein
MILVGVDFLDGSWAALAHARVLSLATDWPVEALYVRAHDEPGVWEPKPEELRWMEKAELSPPEVHTRQGVPWVELVRFARDRQGRMIVVGRHRGSGFPPFSLGSTAHRLATNAPDSVLLVSGPPEEVTALGRGFAESVEPFPGRRG